MSCTGCTPSPSSSARSYVTRVFQKDSEISLHQTTSELTYEITHVPDTKVSTEALVPPYTHLEELSDYEIKGYFHYIFIGPIFPFTQSNTLFEQALEANLLTISDQTVWNTHLGYRQALTLTHGGKPADEGLCEWPIWFQRRCIEVVACWMLAFDMVYGFEPLKGKSFAQYECS
jgi:hypothetical protein